MSCTSMQPSSSEEFPSGQFIVNIYEFIYEFNIYVFIYEFISYVFIYEFKVKYIALIYEIIYFKSLNTHD